MQGSKWDREQLGWEEEGLGHLAGDGASIAGKQLSAQLRQEGFGWLGGVEVEM